MSFRPDIVVAHPEEGLRLVAEAKLQLADRDAAERQLARYMFGMRCPVGMIITLVEVRLYRDTFASRGESSVACVGAFATPAALASQVPPTGRTQERALVFEGAAQRWLEDLAANAGLAALDEEGRRLLEENVLPALRCGEIRAGHPRWRRTGT